MGMTEASDAWMDDFEPPASDSDDEQEQDEQMEEKATGFDIQKTEGTKQETQSKANINLPMTGSSDAWMDNFETPTFESDSETENEPETKEEHKKFENIIPKVTENKTNISLPMTEASEAWMDEFEAPAFDSDDELEETEKLGENARATEVSITEITKETKSDANISL